MTMHRKSRGFYNVLLIAVILLFNTGNLAAQSDDAYVGFTPYSIFGVGELSQLGSSYNLAMGGIGRGVRDSKKINLTNPASLTERDSLSFLFDFGVSQSNIYSRGDGLTSASNLFNMHHIVMSFPLYKNSAFSLGITPYSSVGYHFEELESEPAIIEEIGDVYYQRMGTGGISKAFLGLSATFLDKLSVGGEAIYYFGTISKESKALFSPESSYRGIRVGEDALVRSFSAKFGAQYEESIAEGVVLTGGATYLIGGKLGGTISKFALASSTIGMVDTISFSSGREMMMEVPGELGIGFSLRKKDKWMVGLDYTYQNWGGINFEPTPGVNFSTRGNNTIRAGFEYIPNLYDIRYYSKRISYRGGVYYENGHMKLDGVPINSIGITAGVTLPLIRMQNGVGIAVDFGKRGIAKASPVKEYYIKFNLSFSIYDLWFMKFRYD